MDRAAEGRPLSALVCSNLRIRADASPGIRITVFNGCKISYGRSETRGVGGEPVDMPPLQLVPFAGGGHQHVCTAVVRVIHPVEGQARDHHIDSDFVGNRAEKDVYETGLPAPEAPLRA